MMKTSPHQDEIIGFISMIETINQPLQSIIIKLASRCNLACTYCYWFKDPDVYHYPAKLTTEVESAFLRRLEEHIQAYQLKYFDIVLHGGEPMLFSKRRFIQFLYHLDKISKTSDCTFQYAITTNGVLIDKEWADILKYFNIQVCISIDGPPEIHDKYRKDLKGKGTYAATVAGIQLLRDINIEPSIISVCDPTSSPSILLKTLVDTFAFKLIDILIPDANHDSGCTSIAAYYMKLIDLWMNDYSHRGVRIRILEGMIRSFLGFHSKTQSIGIGHVNTTILNPDGSLEPLDVLRIAGHHATKTDLNIITHPLQTITEDKLWREVFYTSGKLPKPCQSCEIKAACGAGDLAQRFSSHNGYDNPSVYCHDYKKIFAHLNQRLVEQANFIERQL